MIKLSHKLLDMNLALACALFCVVPAWSQVLVARPQADDSGLVATAGADEVPVPQGWLLSYDDEFNGTSVDPALWDISNGPARGDNGGQYWAPSLDLLQYFGNNPRSVQFGNFWEGPNGTTQQALNHSAMPGFDPSQWHTYTLNWEPGDLSWYIDGVLCAEQQFHVPTEPMGLLLSNMVGSYAGDPSAGVWPKEQDIDYVRVYRLAGLPPPVTAGPDQQVQLAPVPASAKGKPAATDAIVSLQGSCAGAYGQSRR